MGSGVFIAVLGLCGVVLALIEYPTWEENKDILQMKEYLGTDTDEDHRTYDVQTVAVFGGFFVGGPLLMIGVVMTAMAMSYNSKLDALTLQRATVPDFRPSSVPSGRPMYCAYCGQPTESKPFCAYCGKKT